VLPVKNRKKGSAETKDKKDAKVWMSLVKGLLAGVIFTTASILLFALLIKTGVLGEASIPAVNEIIKITGVLLSAFITAHRQQRFGWLKGGAAGAAYLLLGWLVFSLIEGEFGQASVLFVDMLMGLIIGAITGIAAPHLKKRSRAEGNA
jgi:putative membrane protein (TIGR04086 family)